MRALLLLLCFLAHSLYGEMPTTIGIFMGQGSPQFDPSNINTGITGSEEAVVYMADALAKEGYKVVVLGNPPENTAYGKAESNPRYVKWNYNDNTKFDIAIAWRMPYAGVELKNRASHVYLWPHDTYHWPLSAEQINAFDDVLWLSKWQRQQWAAVNPGFEKFSKIFGNGIIPEQFKDIGSKNNPYSCIYSSNYARGLEILLDIWPEIKKEFPQATLDIYYGWNSWGLLSAEKEAKMRGQVAALKDLGVTEHGLVGHEELSRAYEKASLWTYPCIAPETFCITALRAQMGGALPVIIEGSALAETVGQGFKCQPNEDYLTLLRRAMQSAETISMEERAQNRQFVLDHYSWQSVAHAWNNLFQETKPTKTVLLAILARNKAHVLPSYLACIDAQDYDKKLITVYINTNNNSDETETILKTWARAHEKDYKQILFETHTVENLDTNAPHDWTQKKLKTLASIRNKSLRVAKDCGCDYYFVVDCDNFIVPATLKTLISKNKPIIAPLLRSIPEAQDYYANFFSHIDMNGYCMTHSLHFEILDKRVQGTIKVPVVHCTYLVDSKFIDDLSYTDCSNDYEFLVFCRSARLAHVDQYICNELDFGVQLHYHTSYSLEEEVEKFKNLTLQNFQKDLPSPLNITLHTSEVL